MIARCIRLRAKANMNCKKTSEEIPMTKTDKQRIKCNNNFGVYLVLSRPLEVNDNKIVYDCFRISNLHTK